MNTNNIVNYKIAIMIDSPFIESWKLSIIKDLIDLSHIDNVQIFSVSNSKNLQQKDVYPQSLYMRYIEKRLFDISYDSLALESVTSLNLNIENINGVNEENFDIVINLSQKKYCNYVSEYPTYGVWSYFFQELGNSHYSNVIKHAYFKNTGYLTVGVTSEIKENEAVILYEKKSGLDNVSMTVSFENILWGCVDLLPRLVEKTLRNQVLKRTDDIAFDRAKVNFSISNSKVSLSQDLHCLAKYAKQAVIRYGMSCNWVLLFSRNEENAEGRTRYQRLREFNKIFPPKGHFWADPFVVEKDDLSYVFFEELSYQSGKGYIRYIVINSDGSHSEPLTILDKPYHLSYPFIFEYGGEYYMIPESGDNKTIELYRCSKFPDDWEFVKNLAVDTSAYDTTLVEHDGRWWMFTCEAQHVNCMTSEELYVYHSDNPLSENWIPHKNNPVIADVTTARPAGEFFRNNGKLYRPSQNNAGIYGKGININEVVELTTDSYVEKTIYTDSASWSQCIEGIHTYNQGKTLAVSDAQYYQRLRRFA